MRKAAPRICPRRRRRCRRRGYCRRLLGYPPSPHSSSVPRPSPPPPPPHPQPPPSPPCRAPPPWRSTAGTRQPAPRTRAPAPAWVRPTRRAA
eukprot:scaffold6305_cov36-Phaeocystis_antarctica.AAC.1